MRILVQMVCAGVLLIGLATYALIAADPAAEKQPGAAVPGMALPEYDKDGKLLRPVGYEKWVVVGTSIGLGYSDGDKPDPNNPGTFHNVYLQPQAFDHYVATGKFPEQTVFIVTNNSSQPAKTKGPVSRTGFVAAPTSGLEIAIKDSKKYPDGWAYFMFHDKLDKSKPAVRAAQAAFERKDCFDCHAEHGAVDNVFTQFYSVLTDARERRLAQTALNERLPFPKDVIKAERKSVEIRLVGAKSDEERVPLAGVEVIATDGYGDQQKKFGPFKTDDTGTLTASLPPGFYTLHLKSEQEFPYLTVEERWNKRSRTAPPALNLKVAESGIEKWLDGERRDDGGGATAKSAAVPRLTYKLLPACELVLRVVDAETGQGLPGATFYEENALGEDWAHDIDGENLGWKEAVDPKDQFVANQSDKDGYFRRLVGANAGFKYGVEKPPAGYESADRLSEVEIDVVYGQRRAEHTFKYRRVQATGATN